MFQRHKIAFFSAHTLKSTEAHLGPVKNIFSIQNNELKNSLFQI
jgi:hypothetical protein